jgi:hypothetical protein
MYDCCGMLLVMTVGQLFGVAFWLVGAEATFASTPFVTSQSNYPWRCEQFERKAANPGTLHWEYSIQIYHSKCVLG